ncbi:hypothetical protein GGR57DRAFT_469900 [Xylariaceae sp. FL1272]|nr:hypothetical protein GGR57DRAFT_469900 [Xylariaceae sp. FL1272]
MAECMPKLTQIFFQQAQKSEREDLGSTKWEDQALADTVPLWPGSIRKVTLFRLLSVDGGVFRGLNHYKNGTKELEESMLQRMKQLEEYHDIFFINATRLKVKQGPWPRLTRLTITSWYGRGPDEAGAVNRLLHEYACITSSMPNAKSIDLILWDAECRFQHGHDRFVYFSCEITSEDLRSTSGALSTVYSMTTFWPTGIRRYVKRRQETRSCRTQRRRFRWIASEPSSTNTGETDRKSSILVS